MLHVRPRTGTRVLSPEHWNHLDRDVLRWKQAGDATALLRDTGELRRIAMEVAAARPARRGYVEADIAFHRALLDAGGNRTGHRRSRRGRDRPVSRNAGRCRTTSPAASPRCLPHPLRTSVFWQACNSQRPSSRLVMTYSGAPSVSPSAEW